MKSSNYEFHTHSDPEFPFIFNKHAVERARYPIPHWHESIEIVCGIDGKGEVLNDMQTISVGKGDIVVINSESLHGMRAREGKFSYFYFIIDKSFTDAFGITVEMQRFTESFRDEKIAALFRKISVEMERRDGFYQQAVRSLAIEMLVRLCRMHFTRDSQSTEKQNAGKLAMVKAGIDIIRKRYAEEITVEEICDEIGYSKFYFCHGFKECTGKTVIEYINCLRCNHARMLMRYGGHNVSESARMSGIPNLSYFSKIYKRYIGILPSEEKIGIAQ